MKRSSPLTLLLLLATFSMKLSSAYSAVVSICNPGQQWWDADNSVCVNCTICDSTKQLTVRKPCEIHRDTVCIDLKELKIYWPWLRSKIYQKEYLENKINVTYTSDNFENSIENNDRNYDYYEELSLDEQKVLMTGFSWNMHTSVIVAILSCMFFFVVVLCLSLYHAREWRRLKIRMEKDVEELAAKLKLMQPQVLEEDDSRHNILNHQYSNIPQPNTGKTMSTKKKEFGNVYTEEKHGY